MEKTLCIIKPDGVKKNAVGDIVRRVQESGLKVLCLKMLQLDRKTAGRFYEVHKERPFYHSLIEYMTSGPVVVVALEGANAIQRYRDLIGNTNPEKADEGTIRKLYGESIEANTVHGSDSVENGIIETAFFFSSAELNLTIS